MRYEDVPWDKAGCKNTDVESFYPPNGIPVKAVVRICQECPIVSECGEYAIEHERYGYWAGMAEQTRDHLRRNMLRRRLRQSRKAIA